MTASDNSKPTQALWSEHRILVLAELTRETGRAAPKHRPIELRAGRNNMLEVAVGLRVADGNTASLKIAMPGDQPCPGAPVS